MSNTLWDKTSLTALTLISICSLFLIAVSSRKVHEIGVLSLVTMGLAVLCSWAGHVNQRRKALQVPDASLAGYLRVSASSFCLLTNLAVLAGVGLLRGR